jgi:hypothetical protein
MLGLAGHMSRAMLERCSHIRLKAKREVVDTLKLADRSEISIGYVKLIFDTPKL